MKEVFYYGRISTESQNLDTQIDRFKLLGAKDENIFLDKDSGKNDNRVELQKMLSKLRKGDKVVFYDLTRLGRNLKYLITLVEHFYKTGIDFQDLTNPFINTESTKTAEGELVFLLFASLGQYFRKSSNEKVKAGLASARARGKVGGRPKGLSEKLKEKAPVAVIMHKNPDVSIKDIMKALTISQGSVYRCFEHEGYDYKRQHKNTGNKNAAYKAA
ncbi:Site-specific DNA recombinase [Tenacibaculum sp. MAR_2009_124]|uniref:recombinase family protein n=1 Tax=Tenacibaculum sp. MAR_2009_124 TaxID=1250059 RepID=UPI00089A4613|nr:recombinase family protein [Tenacibaculum sp. MAR_2009_124]SED21507.1 Site-specific DNA recombinase [Tenacibaculum sp. MAR_2009_124]